MRQITKNFSSSSLLGTPAQTARAREVVTVGPLASRVVTAHAPELSLTTLHEALNDARIPRPGFRFKLEHVTAHGAAVRLFDANGGEVALQLTVGPNGASLSIDADRLHPQVYQQFQLAGATPETLTAEVLERLTSMAAVKTALDKIDAFNKDQSATKRIAPRVDFDAKRGSYSLSGVKLKISVPTDGVTSIADSVRAQLRTSS
jgi:hypothetical protein